MKKNQQAKKGTFDFKSFFISIAVILGVFLIYTFAFNTKASGRLLIDNPTTYQIKVQVDDQLYVVAPHQHQNIELEKGKHKISCRESGIINQIIDINPVNYGIINPTKSKYIIYNIVTIKKEVASGLQSMEFNGKKVFYYPPLGKPQETTDLFIADFSQGLGNINVKETKPKDFTKFDENISYVRKIFREQEFSKFWSQRN